MNDDHDKQPGDLLSGAQIRKAAADRQARLIERRALDGWHRKTIWIHEPSRLAGVSAGEAGEPCDPTKVGEEYRVSWAIGWEAGSKR